MAQASWASSAGTRKSMLGNKRRDTKPELAVRRLLHARGLRYRVDMRPEPDLPRRADILFTRKRVAVFIDGCYWHGCPEHYTAPKTNADFWRAKVDRNRQRDLDTTMVLQDRGWLVLRFWTHEEPSLAAEAIAVAVGAA